MSSFTACIFSMARVSTLGTEVFPPVRCQTSHEVSACGPFGKLWGDLLKAAGHVAAGRCPPGDRSILRRSADFQDATHKRSRQIFRNHACIGREIFGIARRLILSEASWRVTAKGLNGGKPA
jgi:hypothetical protein